MPTLVGQTTKQKQIATISNIKAILESATSILTDVYYYHLLLSSINLTHGSFWKLTWKLAKNGPGWFNFATYLISLNIELEGLKPVMFIQPDTTVYFVTSNLSIYMFWNSFRSHSESDDDDPDHDSTLQSLEASQLHLGSQLIFVPSEPAHEGLWTFLLQFI